MKNRHELHELARIKSRLAGAFVALLVTAVTASRPPCADAQTDITATNASGGTTTIVNPVSDSIGTNGWAQAFENGVAFAENTALTNSLVQVEAGVLRGQTTHNLGGFADGRRVRRCWGAWR